MTQPLIKVLLAGLAALALGGAALSISPVYHNFGEVAVQASKTQEFQITLPPGTARGTTLRYSIMGPDAVDFILMAASTQDPFDPNFPCPPGAQGVICTMGVEFRPRSMGLKKATLVVTDGRGSSNSATVEGTAVAALCKPTVVWCNYAHHYSGVFSWSDGNDGVNVDVVQGVASCNVMGDPTPLASGPGLIAVEFDRDEDSTTFFRITVACPTRYPPEPVRPVEFGKNDLSTYKQPLAMTIERVNAGPPRLKGRDDEVSWNLCPNSQYRRPVRAGAGALGPQDPCPP